MWFPPRSDGCHELCYCLACTSIVKNTIDSTLMQFFWQAHFGSYLSGQPSKFGWLALSLQEYSYRVYEGNLPAASDFSFATYNWEMSTSSVSYPIDTFILGGRVLSNTLPCSHTPTSLWAWFKPSSRLWSSHFAPWLSTYLLSRQEKTIFK